MSGPAGVALDALPPQQVAVGIDGCRGGWIAVAVDGAWRPAWQLASTVEALLAQWPGARCLIDIPIGLPAGTVPRRVEREARRMLGRPRAASVFPVPCRDAVYAADYETACRVNRARLGGAVSRQAWNILPKVREVDALLARQPQRARSLHEAHPELCFLALAGGVAMAGGKKTVAGRDERIRLLAGWIPGVGEWIDEVLRQTRRAALACDDLVDALALAVSARLALARIPSAAGEPPAPVGGAAAPAGGAAGAAVDGEATMVFPAMPQTGGGTPAP